MSEPTPAGGAILSAAAVAEWALAAAWATDEYQDNNHWTAEQRRVVTEGLPAVIASHAAHTARLAAVEAERAAQDGRWRALVGELTEWCDILLTLTDATAPIVEATYGQADPAGWMAQRETVACIRARLRQRRAALDGEA